jgi:hypothetical protein
VSRGGEEPKRIFGIVLRDLLPLPRYEDEQRHVLGLPADWFGPVDDVSLRPLVHPIKTYKHWALIRRLGPYAPDDDDPPSTG